jgi:RNA polymerase sigma-19 factor, ECF subfamily
VDLERIRAGDDVALAALLEDAWAPLVRYLASILGGVDAAEDAAQEAFVRLWEHRERWLEGSARAVLFRIGRNAALDALRVAEVRAPPVRVADTSPAPGPSQDVEQEGRELEARVRSAVASLPAARREVFELVRLRGLGYAEVATVLGLAPQTVANHMSLALRDLRSLLADILPASSRDAGSRSRSTDG